MRVELVLKAKFTILKWSNRGASEVQKGLTDPEA